MPDQLLADLQIHTCTRRGTPTRGTVIRLAAVHCRYAPVPGSEVRVGYPVPGSGVLTEVESADGWTADRGDERFAGYLVQLEL